MELARLDLADFDVADKLLTLQKQAYEVEARLIGSREIPPLTETLQQLQSCGETFLGAFIEGYLVGAISWRILGDTIDIHRLMVDPRHLRRGIGVTLIRAALATESSVTRAIVQTGADNEPARALYLGEGFDETAELEVVPGLRIARFRKQLR
jgi:GNAT superfamily N-acetyltransferase